MKQLKDKKVWAPLVGIVALAAGWQNGVGIPVEQVDELAGGLALLAQNAEALYLAAMGLLGVVAAWFGLKG